MVLWRRVASILAVGILGTVLVSTAPHPSSQPPPEGVPGLRSARAGEQEALSGVSTNPADATVSAQVRVISALRHDISPALRSLPPAKKHKGVRLVPEFEGVLPQVANDVHDPVVQRSNGLAPSAMPATDKNFAGMSNISGLLPPDTNGDVGPNHYVQTVNATLQVFDKTGVPLTSAVDTSSLFTGFGGLCETTNDGDPIVQYDQAADRWLISQFAFDIVSGSPVAPFDQCFAVSTTADPTGTYFRYAFQSPNNRFNDYGKIGVWPDAYYMSVNEFSEAFAFQGVGAWAMDRTNMLAGNAATMQYFHLGTGFGSLLPSDLDGATAPPAGAPNPFMSFDDFTNPGSFKLKVFNYHVDFATPANSTFNAATDITLAAFDRNFCNFSPCIPQPGTSATLDTLADRLMYRLAYRNFGDHQTIVVTHSVDVGGDVAGIRWYELRKTSGAWGLFQQGTFGPDATSRWMGSAAMDADGNMAVGYSVSSGSVFPGVRYAGRLATDPSGVLSQGESSLVDGAGSQTSISHRWGDYSSMSVDPTDDCTFWYTTEYYTSSSIAGWTTRVGSFKFPSCSNAPPPTTTLSIKAPGKVSKGTKVTIAGTLNSTDPACMNAQQVTLKKGTATLAPKTTSAVGAYKFVTKITKQTSVQATYSGTISCASSTSATKTIHLK